MFVMRLQMLVWVFMGSGESNLIFLKKVLDGLFVQREFTSTLFIPIKKASTFLLLL